MAKCTAKTLRGSRCSFNALPGEKLCRRHRDAASEATPKKDWRVPFLEAFAKTGLVIAAAKAVGIDRTTAYRERQANEDFALAWADIEEWTTEEMEQEARRRAVLGVKEPVYNRGQLVGHVRKYSDTLLIFLLKGRKPGMYRDNVHVEHGGAIRTDPVEVRADPERLIEVGTTLAEIGVIPVGGDDA